MENNMGLQSCEIFAEIAYDCLNEKRWERPSIDEIVPRLKKALELQLERQNAKGSQRPNIDEIVTRLEKALELQLAPEIWPIMSSPKDLSYLKVPLENIVIATNNFAEANLFSTSGFAQEYKGTTFRRGLHKNLVSIVGFCDESDEKIIIINRNETKGWLNDYLCDPMLLTWVRRLEVCVCIAHALSYIHYDEHRDFSVIHRNISSGTLLLYDDWEPKLSNFERSMMIKASQRHNSFHNETLHYTDIHSFGIVLFELLCARRAIIVDEQDNKYLDPVAIFHFR
ncbi:kinase-like domain, phloem protein 2-like protein [Tanacetum coccineum]